jgi:hypothetical protein
MKWILSLSVAYSLSQIEEIPFDSQFVEIFILYQDIFIVQGGVHCENSK